MSTNAEQYHNISTIKQSKITHNSEFDFSYVDTSSPEDRLHETLSCE